MSGNVRAFRLAPLNQGLGRPPLPREHGAWVMLVTPLVIGLAGVGAVSPAAAGLLVVAVVAAFLAQNAAGAMLKPRAPLTTATWLGIFSAVMAGAGLTLVAGLGRWWLLALALPAAALFLLHVKLLKGPAAARLDRTLWGELLAAGALTLTGPAAVVAATGVLDGRALALWLAALAAFASGVFHVNMRLDAVKVREAFTWATRWRLGKGLVAFHAAMTLAIALAASLLPAPAGWLTAAAFMPFVVRGAVAFIRLEKGVPSFKAIGIRETMLTTWFALCLIAVLRVMG